MYNGYKYVLNNCQFYESEQLALFLNGQAEKSYILCRMYGRFGRILKFRKSRENKTACYLVCNKYYDKWLDEKIEELKAHGWKTVCENVQLIVFEIHTEERNKSIEIKEKQNLLLGFSTAKAGLFIGIHMFMFVAFSAFRMLWLGQSSDRFYLAKCMLCIALFLNFLLYLTGDLYDIKRGRSVSINGKRYFTKRTGLKNKLFSAGDFSRIVLLCLSIAGSAWIWFGLKDILLILENLQMWLVYCVEYIIKLRYRNSYIFLLLLAVHLLLLGF